MKLYVIDNGGRYSNHAVWFVEAGDFTREQVETFLKLVNGPEPHEEHRVIGYGDIDYVGPVATFETIANSSWRHSDWTPEEGRKLLAELPEALRFAVLFDTFLG